ncbi:MAG: hypothetical protein E6L09_08200 [Verrucomicrobia bacterium]|nr:MAG: hypothetical protein E6L09_08200 [Verrucomicrobiota bacterium]
MNLDEAQKRTVADWIAQGLKLSEIQSRLANELDVHLTYMDVRLLVDDLKLVPKDREPRAPVELSATPRASGLTAPAEGGEPSEGAGELLTGEEAPADAGGISITVDQLARPGALVSGSVTFRDGNSAAWYLDQYGRLGLAPKQQGYKPSAKDLQAFQEQLQSELAKLGF